MKWYEYIFFWNYLPWWQSLLIFLIPFEALLLFLLLSFLVDYLQRVSKAKACLRTENFLKSSSFGLVTYLCGNIGAGKTTCGSAICNMLSSIKMKQASSMVSKVVNIMSDIDFNGINSFILMAFHDVHLTNSDAIMNYLLEHDKNLSSKIEGRFYDNYLYPTSYVSLFRDYIDAYLSLIRNNYVYFQRRKFYCWVTDNWAMDYLPSMIDIKDRYLSKDYKIQRYATIFEDEKILSGKNNMNYREVASDDGGGDEFFRLIRHLGKGTIHYISTAQDFNRVVKQERELATGVFYVRKRHELPLMCLNEIFVNIAYDFLNRYKVVFFGFKEVIRKKKEDKIKKRLSLISQSKEKYSYNEDYVFYLDSLQKKLSAEYQEVSKNILLMPSKIKSRLSILERKMTSFFADSYINYKGEYYTCADDVGKEKEQCKSLVISADFCFPLVYSYGSVDTYSFSILNDYLSMVSIHSGDFYNPDNHDIPFESDETFSAYMKSIVGKNKKPKKAFGASNVDSLNDDYGF